MLSFFCLVLFFAALFFPHLVFRDGWIPHDEGFIGISASRIVNGEIPHADFQDGYSGGLSYVHALAFRVWGESVLTLRIVHLLAFQLFQLFFFWSAWKWLANWRTATLLLLLMTLWSAPNYPASMPSWYVAYFAYAAMISLVFGQQRARPGHAALIAGVMAGLAFSVKVTGLYILMASALSIVYFSKSDGHKHWIVNCGPFPLLKVLTISLLTVIPVAILLGARMLEIHGLYFYLPFILLLIASTTQMDRVEPARLMVEWVKLGFGFALGALPLLLTLVGRTPGLGAFINDVFIKPGIQVANATMPPPSLESIGIALLTLAAGLLSVFYSNKARPAIILLVVAAFLLAGSIQLVYQSVWTLLRLIPLLLMLWFLWRQRVNRIELVPAPYMTIAAFVCWLSLAQYPYAFGIYVFYCIPLFAAVLFIGLNSNKPVVQFYARVATLVLAAYAALWVNPGNFRTQGAFFTPRPVVQLAEDERIMIKIPPGHIEHYEKIVEHVRRHTSEHEPILAFPDIHEIYFLSDRTVPVSWSSDFFAPFESYTGYLEVARKKGVKVMVVNQLPEFCRAPMSWELDAILSEFPMYTRYGHIIVFTREDLSRKPSQ